MEFLEEYQNYIALGILLNIVSTVGFGMYKAFNISESEALYLVSTYEAKADMLKLGILWCIPFLGFGYVLKEVVMLQMWYINRGYSIFNYIEDKIKEKSK